MQSVTTIAPAIAALFFTPFVVSLAGVASPLAYPIGFVITLLLGIVLVQFTKKLPAAGGYYTFISRSLHPRLGWLVAWLFILYAPTVGGIVSLYMGNILQQELQANWGINWPWFPAVFMIVVITGVALLQYRGISISGRILLILGLIEMGLVFLLAIWAIANPGPGGVNFDSYNPANISITGVGAFALAIVFSPGFYRLIAPLAEETANRPKFPEPLLARSFSASSWSRHLGDHSRLGYQNHRNAADFARIACNCGGQTRMGTGMVARPNCALELDLCGYVSSL
jgi:amino acid transporter